MFEEITKIELSGNEYPLKCDLLVLEKIQEVYGTIKNFEEGLITWETELDEAGEAVKDTDGKIKVHGKFPIAKTVNDALYWMVCEGEAIKAEDEGRKAEDITRESLLRKTDVPLVDLANVVHEEFYRCFKSKNGKTTQGQEEK